MGESKRVKARKRHVCSFCRDPIQPGEQHVYQRLTPWDHPDNDSFSDYRAHVACDDLWQDIGHEYEWVFPEAYEFRDALAESARVLSASAPTSETTGEP